MFQVRLVVVPAGGGEADYSLDMMVPALPRQGDYISVLRSGNVPKGDAHVGSEDFIVRRVWWMFDFPDDGQPSHTSGKAPVGNATEIGIEVEFAVGPYSSHAHRNGAGPDAQHFEATAY
jgi:hypothetical protein